MITVIRADSPQLWSAATRLVEQYAASLGIALDFQDFERERSNLASEYGPPDGVFLLAQVNDEFIGCGAIRRFSHETCEMKRLYVIPRRHGGGVGRRLATALIEEARRLGYRRILLDTLPSMQRAQALYASLGFVETSSYRYNPVAGTKFFQLDL